MAFVKYLHAFRYGRVLLNQLLQYTREEIGRLLLLLSSVVAVQVRDAGGSVILNLVDRCSTIIDVIIVLPAPGMPGQNKVCLLVLSHPWNSFESNSHCPVPSCRLLMKSLC